MNDFKPYNGNGNNNYQQRSNYSQNNNWNNNNYQQKTFKRPENLRTFYTDGGCKYNKQDPENSLGAWAFYDVKEDYRKSRAVERTTNNRMEITAAIEALKYIDEMKIQGPFCFVTDSMYLQKGALFWIKKWKSNGWKLISQSNEGGNVKNADLWQELDKLMENKKIYWDHVKAHSGEQYNEICDSLVKSSMESFEHRY